MNTSIPALANCIARAIAVWAPLMKGITMRLAQVYRIVATSAGAMVLVGGAATVPVLAHPAPTPAAERPAVPGERQARMMRARVLTFGILMYTKDHDSHFPQNLGATLQYQDKDPGARVFLTPEDEHKTQIPDHPSATWVNDNTSFVYLADGNITTKSLAAANVKAYALPIVHEKLEGREGREVAIGFVDGHSVMMRFAEARKVIDEATQNYARMRGR